MDPAIKTIFILSVVFGAIFLSRYMRHRMRMFEMTLRTEKEFSGSLKVELDEIRDRLAALEVIVTNKGYQIKEEINNL